MLVNDVIHVIIIYTFVIMQYKGVASDPMYLKHALSMGTLIWKVSQILCLP